MTYRHTVVKQKKITSRRRNYGIVKRQANTEQNATKLRKRGSRIRKVPQLRFWHFRSALRGRAWEKRETRLSFVKDFSRKTICAAPKIFLNWKSKIHQPYDEPYQFLREKASQWQKPLRDLFLNVRRRHSRIIGHTKDPVWRDHFDSQTIEKIKEPAKTGQILRILLLEGWTLHVQKQPTSTRFTLFLSRRNGRGGTL